MNTSDDLAGLKLSIAVFKEHEMTETAEGSGYPGYGVKWHRSVA